MLLTTTLRSRGGGMGWRSGKRLRTVTFLTMFGNRSTITLSELLESSLGTGVPSNEHNWTPASAPGKQNKIQCRLTSATTDHNAMHNPQLKLCSCHLFHHLTTWNCAHIKCKFYSRCYKSENFLWQWAHWVINYTKLVGIQKRSRIYKVQQILFLYIFIIWWPVATDKLGLVTLNKILFSDHYTWALYYKVVPWFLFIIWHSENDIICFCVNVTTQKLVIIL
jgi:hypothetical protein